MAGRRSSRILWLVALLALAGGTASLLLTGGGAPAPGGPHDLRWRPLPSAGEAAGPATGVSAPGASSPSEPIALPAASLPADLLVRVLDEAAGTPVPGARVEAEDANGVWSGRADGGGEVRFRGLEGGGVQVRVLLDGALVGVSGTRVSPDALATLEVRVAPAVRVTGRVTSAADGGPVEGATVAVEIRNHDRRFPPPPAQSGADGSYSLPAGKGKDWVAVAATAPGFVRGTAYRPLPWEAGTSLTLDFRLDPAVAVSGTVRDPAGSPVAGAVVVAEPAGRDHAPPDPGTLRFADPADRPLAAVTGPDGAYRLDGLLPGGAFRILARKDGFAPSKEGNEVLLPGGGSLALDLTLQRSGEIFAAWSGGEGRGPVLATVRVRDASGATVAESSGQGTCRIPGIAPGPCTVIVASEENGSARGAVEVRAGETVKVDLVLGFGEGLLAEGVVVDRAGAPVPRARVLLVGVDGGDGPGPALVGERFPLEATAGRDGRFALDGGGARLPSARLFVRAGGFLHLLTPPRELPARDLRLVLDRGGAIHLRLEFPPGVPRQGDAGMVLCFQPEEGPLVSRRGGVRDMTGEFRWEGLPAGRGWFSARAGNLLVEERSVEVPAGGVADLGVLPFEAGADLEGRVVDGAGAPVPGARVMPAGPLHQDLFAEAGGDGRFTLRGLPDGTVELLLVAPGFAETRAWANAARGAADLVISKGGLLRIAARDGAGLPLSEGSAAVAGGEGFRVGLRLDARGRGEVRLPGGVYRVVIQRGDATSDAEEVVLAEGATVDLERSVR